MMLQFTVPGRPRPKARARVFWDPRAKKFRAANPASTAHYSKTVAGYALHARQGFAFAPELPAAGPSHGPNVARGPWPLSGRYSLDVTAYLGRQPWPDWDNIGKAISDACTKILWRNDRQIVDAAVHLRPADLAGERAEVTVALVGALTGSIV